jgi:hypothetical protein
MNTVAGNCLRMLEAKGYRMWVVCPIAVQFIAQHFFCNYYSSVWLNNELVCNLLYTTAHFTSFVILKVLYARIVLFSTFFHND